MPDLSERLAEIEARCEAATPGPWHFVHENAGLMQDHGYGLLFGEADVWGWEKNLFISVGCSFRTEAELGKGAGDANAAFIANARTDIPFLLAEVRRLQAENASVMSALASMNAVIDHQTDRLGGKERDAGNWGVYPKFHPLTCGNDSSHTPLFPYWTGERVILICRDCGYTQNNAAMFSVPGGVMRQAESEWQPIETAPKDGSMFLGCVVGFAPLVAAWDDYGNRWVSQPDEYGYEPTHWLPLPAPPPTIERRSAALDALDGEIL